MTDGKDTVVSSPQPFMYDSTQDPQGEPGASVALDTDVTVAADGAPQLSVAADQAFLDNPATQYPVTIDPTVTAYDAGGDTYVETPSPLSGNQNDPQLRVGTYDGGTHKARSYMRFDSRPWSGSRIIAGQLVMFNSSSSQCTGSDIQASQITQYWDPSTVSWANQPAAGANPVNNFPAYGASGCPANYARWDITPMVSSWNAGGPAYGIRLQAVSGTSNASWRVYYSDNSGSSGSNPHINVTYNTPPNPATTPSISRVNTYTAPGSSSSTTYVDSTRPTFSTTVSDPDGGNLAAVIYAKDMNNNVVSNCGTDFVPSGGTVSCQLGVALNNGSTYYVVALSSDGTDSGTADSPTSQTFTVAEGLPSPPTTSCPSYANSSWTTTVPGGATSCTLSAPSSGPAQTGYIDYTVGNGTMQRAAITASADPAVAKTTVTVPTTAGRHTITAYAESVAGDRSTSAANYAFGFGTKATMDTPGGQALTTVTNGVTLGASGPPGTITSLDNSKAYVQWRLAGSGNDAYTGWTDASSASQKLAVTRDQSGAVRVTGTWDASTATQPAGATAPLDKRVSALLDIQVCIKYDDGTHCSWDGTHRQVEHVPHAFGDNFPIAAVGDGQVALWTGEFNTSATDATLAAGNTSLSISRSAASFYGAATSTASGVFGPGWVASLDGPDGGDAGLVVTDNTRVDGTITAQDSDGDATAFVPVAGQAQRTNAFTTGTWKPVDEDSVEAGLTAKIDVSSGSPVFSIIEPDGTQTDFTSATVDGNTNATFVPSAVAEAGQPGKTTYQYTSGKVTRILAPVPNGVTCPASGTLPAGCRALVITYASSTTATFTATGDIVGQVKTISTVKRPRFDAAPV